MSEQEKNGEVQEPENSTVDDWFGQNVARDQEVADKVSAESDSDVEAEERFDEEADGEQRYAEGHGGGDRRSEPSGDAVGDPGPT